MWVVVQAAAGRSIRTENLGFCTINCRPNASPLHNTYAGFSVKSFYWTGVLVPRGLVELVFRCILDERSLKAYELEAPPVAVKKFVEFCLHTRAWVLSYLPPRTRSGLFVDRPSRSYPDNNYDVAKLGPSDENLKKISG
jgi:hypothetical protein